MIEVKIPRDIRGYEAKLFAGLTTRQAIFGASAVAVVLGVNYVFSDYIPIEDARILLSIFFALPFLLCGWIKPQGLPFEVYFRDVFLRFYIEEPIRKYETKNLWEDAFKYTDEEGEMISEKYYESLKSKEKQQKANAKKYKPKKSQDKDDIWLS